MISLHTPREVLAEAIKAAKQDKDAPPNGLSMFYAVRAKLLERGLLDMAMTSQSIDDLLDEMTDEVLKPEAPIDLERTAGPRLI